MSASLKKPIAQNFVLYSQVKFNDAHSKLDIQMNPYTLGLKVSLHWLSFLAKPPVAGYLLALANLGSTTKIGSFQFQVGLFVQQTVFDMFNI